MAQSEYSAKLDSMVILTILGCLAVTGGLAEEMEANRRADSLGLLSLASPLLLVLFFLIVLSSFMRLRFQLLDRRGALYPILEMRN